MAKEWEDIKRAPEPEEPEPRKTMNWDIVCIITGCIFLLAWVLYEPYSFRNPRWQIDPVYRAQQNSLITIMLVALVAYLYAAYRGAVQAYPSSKYPILALFMGAPLLFIFYLILTFAGKM